MATITEPMALDESFNTTETTPRNIADVLAEMGEAIAHGMGRQANEVSYDNTTSGLSADDVQEAVDELAAEKVDKVTGKGLSTNDYTTDEKNKLAGIAAGAQVNVQSDWAQTDSNADDYIKNKQLVTEPIEELQNDVKSTQTATGNPITLTDCAPINAESLVVEFSPKQDLHGQSAPYVGGAGKNKLDFTDTTVTSSRTIASDISLKAGNNTVAFDIKNNSNIDGYYLVRIGTTSIGGANFSANYSGRLSKTFTLSEDSVINIFVAGASSGYSFEFSKGQIEEGSTATDFAPYSNICPITGYTECEVDDVGKNLLENTASDDIINGITWTVNNDGSVTANGTVTGSSRSQLSITIDTTKVYGDLLVSCNQPNGTVTDAYVWDRTNGTRVKKWDGTTDSETLTDQTLKQIKIIKGHDCALYLRVATLGSVVSNQMFYPMICVSTETDPTYEPYHSSNATIQFGQTVYGGRSNFTEGGTDVTVDIEDLSTLSWLVGGSSSQLKYASASGYTSVVMAEQYKATNKVPNELSVGECTYYNNRIYVYPVSTSDDILGTAALVLATSTTIATPKTDLKLLQGTNNLTTNGTTINLGYQPDNVIGEVKGEIEDVTPISGTATVTLLHEEDQGEDWIVGFTGEINGHFDIDHFDYYLTARYSHAYNTNTQILNMNNCTDGDYVNIWQTGTVFDFGVDGGVTVDISVTATKLTFTVNCIGDSIFGIYSSSETTGTVKYLITPARKG